MFYRRRSLIGGRLLEISRDFLLSTHKDLTTSYPCMGASSNHKWYYVSITVLHLSWGDACLPIKYSYWQIPRCTSPLIYSYQLWSISSPCWNLFAPIGGFWMFYLGHPLMSTDTLTVYRALGRRTCVEYNPLGATLGTSLDVHCHLSYLSSTR